MSRNAIPSSVENLVDLARDKMATQSSRSPWSRGQTAKEDPINPILRNLPEDYAFHTTREENPYWQIDLSEMGIIQQIEILNRPNLDCEFLHFQVLTSTDGFHWTLQFVEDNAKSVSADPVGPSVFVLNPTSKARYVRIVQMGVNAMHLRQFRILGVPAPQPTTSLPPVTGFDSMKQIISDPAGRDLLVDTIVTAFHRTLLGRSLHSYNIDTVAFLTAAIEANQYVNAQMSKAERFESASALHDFAVRQVQKNGMILEFGVYSGSSINHIAAQLPERAIFGFDSFEGLPETWRPGFVQGAFKTNLPAVRDNVNLVVGWFDETLPKFVIEHPHESLALLHVDCDLYSSTKTIFSLLCDHIVAGTIIVFDEYFNYPEWRLHEHKAFQEFVISRAIKYEYIAFVPNDQQVAIKIISIG